MKPIRNFLRLGVFIFSATALGKDAPRGQQPQQSPTIASIVDLEISKLEKQVMDAAEAMPAEKFNFSPESLNISGSNYKGVRTFALQVKHIAAGSQGRDHFDHPKHDAVPGTQPIDPRGSGHICRCARL